jgi:hypothetical protein
MTKAVRQLLDSFDALPDTDKHEAAVKILRRLNSDKGDLSVAKLMGIADQLFCTLDDEETGHAPR